MLHRYCIADAHCDTLYELWKKGGSLQDHSFHVSLESVAAYGGYTQFFAVWVDDESKTPLEDVMQMLDVFYRTLEQNKENMQQLLTATDCQQAFSPGKLSAILTIENGNALMGSLTNLRLFYRLGVRGLTLTWNGANELADGVGEQRGGGLTEFGRSVVREMNQLGMMIDVSHLSVQGFWDVLAESRAPVMASHSNARAIANHHRNLSDDQIIAIEKQGGFIGLNLYPAFLTDGDSASIDDCVAHLEHIISIAGEDCIGLGSDFDGFTPPMTIGLESPAGYCFLFETLEHRGWSKQRIRKLTHENLIRYVQKVIK